MRSVGQKDADDLPLGYELVRFDNRTSLALPSATATASRAEVQRREDADEDARREALRKRQEETKEAALAEDREKAAKAQAEADNRLSVVGTEAAPGEYRVIRKWAELVNSSEDTA